MVKSACTTIKKIKNCRHPCKKVTMKTKNGKKKICKTKFNKNADPKSCSKKNKKKGKKDAVKSPKKRKTKAPKLIVESDAEPSSDPEVKEEESKDLAQSEPEAEQSQPTPGNPIQGFIDSISTTAKDVSNYDPVKSLVGNQPVATEPVKSEEESKEGTQ
jgi:flagellum-specific peptidoglycan hydrolase FlgJ